jgi:hypothetical protein
MAPAPLCSPQQVDVASPRHARHFSVQRGTTRRMCVARLSKPAGKRAEMYMWHAEQMTWVKGWVPGAGKRECWVGLCVCGFALLVLRRCSLITELRIPGPCCSCVPTCVHRGLDSQVCFNVLVVGYMVVRNFVTIPHRDDIVVPPVMHGRRKHPHRYVSTMWISCELGTQ